MPGVPPSDPNPPANQSPRRRERKAGVRLCLSNHQATLPPRTPPKDPGHRQPLASPSQGSASRPRHTKA